MSDKAVIVANKIKADLKDSQGNSFVVSDDGRILTESQYQRRSEFDEAIVAQKRQGFNLASYEGPTILRNTVETTGSGATVTSASTGEIKISSGTDANGKAIVETNERGVYQPGAQGETGIGIRIGNLPTGDQEAIWGYFDNENGFGWGLDSEGLFVFVRRNGSRVYVQRQDDWKVRKLNGTEDSGIEVDVTQGNIYQTDFVWYGYGPISWSITQRNTENTFDGPQPYRKIVDFYSVKDQEGYKGTSIHQPNLPLNVEIHNNGETSNMDVFLGGRQVSSLGGEGQLPTRRIVSNLEFYSLADNQGTFQPLLAVRKKELFNSFPNPVNAILKSVRFVTDEDATLRTTIHEDVTSANWQNADSWPDNETATEIAKITDGFTVNDSGLRVPPYEIVPAGGTGGFFSAGGPEAAEEKLNTPLGRNQVVVFWARQDVATPPTVSLIVEWAEQF